MTEQYKIISLTYSKPIILRDAHGEAHPGRSSVTIAVGSADQFGAYAKMVDAIEYDEKIKVFLVKYKGGGIKTIPMLSDTEVTYELVTKK